SRVIRRRAGSGKAPTHGGDLHDCSVTLRAHDRQRGARQIDDAIEDGIDQCLEIRRTGFLKGPNVAVAGVVDQNIKAPEALNCQSNGCLRLSFISDVEMRRMDVLPVLIAQRSKRARVSRGSENLVAGRASRLDDVTTQTARASRY